MCSVVTYHINDLLINMYISNSKNSVFFHIFLNMLNDRLPRGWYMDGSACVHLISSIIGKIKSLYQYGRSFDS